MHESQKYLKNIWHQNFSFDIHLWQRNKRWPEPACTMFTAFYKAIAIQNSDMIFWITYVSCIKISPPHCSSSSFGITSCLVLFLFCNFLNVDCKMCCLISILSFVIISSVLTVLPFPLLCTIQLDKIFQIFVVWKYEYYVWILIIYFLASSRWTYYQLSNILFH